MNMRQIALRILDEYEAGGKYVNLALSTHLTDGLSAEEKAALTALLYTTVERKLTYDYYICALAGRSEGDIDPHTKNILRLGLCQLLDMESVPDFAAVNETVALARSKGEKAFVNGVLRAASRSRDSLPMPDQKKKAARFLSVKYSFPLPLVKHFTELYGIEDTEKLLSFYNSEKYTDITVNTLKISAEEYLTLLKKEGYVVEKNGICPLSLRILSSVNPQRLPGFADGLFFVQDRASAISALALGAHAGEVILDVCSAPGGKSFATAILTEDRAEIHSFDLHESKLSLIRGGAERLGIHSVSVGQRDALTPDEGLIGRADRVICDAPCSGLGVLGKKPDLRYKDMAALTELPPLQLDILTASCAYLKVGGELLYSTCTLNPLENEQIVSAFLAEHPDFCAVDFSVGELHSDGGMLTLLPHIHGTDGFFMAKIKKVR